MLIALLGIAFVFGLIFLTAVLFVRLGLAETNLAIPLWMTKFYQNFKNDVKTVGHEESTEKKHS